MGLQNRKLSVILPYPYYAQFFLLLSLSGLWILSEFSMIWMLTSGGPGTATRYVSIHVVREVLQSMNYGYSSAMSLFALFNHCGLLAPYNLY